MRFLAVLPGSRMSLQVHKMTMSIRSNLWRLTRLIGNGPCLKRSQEYGWVVPARNLLGTIKKRLEPVATQLCKCVFYPRVQWSESIGCMRALRMRLWGFRPTMEMITTWLCKPSGGGLSPTIGLLSCWVSFQYWYVFVEEWEVELEPLLLNSALGMIQKVNWD